MSFDKQPQPLLPEEQAKQKSIKVAWEEILSRFPEELAEEFRVEVVGSPEQDDVEMFESVRLLAPQPISVSLKELLKNNENVIYRTPPDVIEEINKKWGTQFDVSLSKVYERDLDRLRRYSQMSPETARPSVLLNGEVLYGTGRFVAALLRGDHDLRVWNLGID